MDSTTEAALTETERIELLANLVLDIIREEEQLPNGEALCLNL